MSNPARNRSIDEFGVRALTLALAVLITWISLEQTGFVLGGNVFGIPYVMRFIDRPEFASDPYVTSLENFTSAVWPPLRWLAPHIDPEALFRLAHTVTRSASICALLLLGRPCGLGVWGASLFTLMVAAGMAVIVDSRVGDHQMFVNVFVQSVVTWPFVFLLLSALLANRLRLAAIALALIFDVNAFVAFWMLVVAAFQRGPALWRSPRKVQLQCVALFLLLVSPVAAWIVGSLAHTGVGTTFSYRQYVREYFPQHFLVEATSGRDLLRLAMYFLAAWFAAGPLRDARFWRLGLAGLLLLFVNGCWLPYVIDTRLIFNLHLLRSDGMLIAVSLIVQSLAFIRILGGASGLPYKFFAGLLAVASFALPFSLLLGIGSTLFFLFEGSSVKAHMRDWLDQRWQNKPGNRAFVSIALASVASVLVLFASHRTYAVAPQPVELVDPSWVEIAGAINREGPAGPYLVPLGEKTADTFITQAQRPAWVSWKEGAAVMWFPAFYAQWSSRLKEVKKLQSAEQMLEYAKVKGIPEVVMAKPAGGCGERYKVRLETGRYVWCSAAP